MAESGRERERAGAFGNHAGAPARRRTAAAVSSSETANAPSSTSRARVHIAGSSAGAPEPSTNETWYSTGRGSPRSNAAVSGAPVSGSTA